LSGEELISEMPWLTNLIIGKKILDIMREVPTDILFKKTNAMSGNDDFFSRGSGSLFIILEDEVIVKIRLSRRLRSLGYWVDKIGKGEYIPNTFEKNGKSNIKNAFISCRDKKLGGNLWHECMEVVVNKLTLLKGLNTDPIYPSMPNQWGIIFHFNNGRNMVIANNHLIDGKKSFPGVFDTSEVNFDIVKAIELPLEKPFFSDILISPKPTFLK